MLKNTAISSLGVITDFDRTVSRGGDETAFSVFSSSPYVSEELKKERKGLYEYYRPIELDLSMREDMRTQHMIDWYNRAMDLFEAHLTQDQLETTIAHAIERIDIRDGMRKFLDFLATHDIPTIIFSAGVSNIIEGVLNHHDIPHNGVHGNHLAFDTNGKCIGVTNSLPIHNENKVWTSLPEELQQKFKNKSQVILLGDSIGDVKMGPEEKELIKIGFLLEAQKNHETEFRKAFDYIVESDNCDNGLLRKITNSLI